MALFSLEMSRFEIGMRLLCAEARVPWDRIRNKRVGPTDWTNVVHAAEVLHDAPLHIVDSGNVNIVDIRAKARRMRTGRTGLDLIIVDYLQLMTSPNTRRPDNRQQEVAEISRSLKLLAKELKIPVIALSQLNRNPESRADKRPQLSDLRESGSLEQDSDVVMFIHRDDADPEKKREAELIVSKHRNGPTGTIKLNFEASLTQFRNAARGEVAPAPVSAATAPAPSAADRRRVRTILRPPPQRTSANWRPRVRRTRSTSSSSRSCPSTPATSTRSARSPTCGPPFPGMGPDRGRVHPLRRRRHPQRGARRSKAPRIQAILREIHEREGAYDLARLRALDDDQVRDYLMSLPGIGPKTAAVVLSLRAGPRRASRGHPRASGLAAAGLDPGRRRRPSARTGSCTTWCREGSRTPLHVAFIRLGREICKAPTPRCAQCPLADLCPTAPRYR